MTPIDICFLTGFIGIWIPQAYWAWLSFAAWQYSIQSKKEKEALRKEIFTNIIIFVKI
jgi:hypothetical protein